MQAKEWHVLRAVIAAGIMSFSGVLIETSMNVTFPTLMNEFQTDAMGDDWLFASHRRDCATFSIFNPQLFATTSVYYCKSIILGGGHFRWFCA